MKPNPNSAPSLDPDAEEASAIRRKRDPEQAYPIYQFLESLSEKETEALLEFLIIDERNRGEVIRLGKKYGQDFWGMREKIENLRRKYNCAPQIIIDAIMIGRLGVPITETDLYAYALPSKKYPVPIEVSNDREPTKNQWAQRVRSWVASKLK